MPANTLISRIRRLECLAPFKPGAVDYAVNNSPKVFEALVCEIERLEAEQAVMLAALADYERGVRELPC